MYSREQRYRCPLFFQLPPLQSSSMVVSPLGLFRLAWTTAITIAPGGDGQAPGPEITNLLPNQLLQPHAVEFLVLEGPVKGRLAHRLIVGAVELLQERMLQSLLHGDALLWVDLKHLAQQIKSIVGTSGELTSQRGDGLFGKLAHEPFGLLRGDEVHIGFGELSKLIRNQGQLRRLK